MQHANVKSSSVYSSSASGMAVYIAYAGWQVSALGETTPTYDIYDSENYPLVLLSPPPPTPLPLLYSSHIAHPSTNDMTTCFCPLVLLRPPP